MVVPACTADTTHVRGLVAIAGVISVAVLAVPAFGGSTPTTSVGTSLRESSIILGRLSAPHGRVRFFVHNYGQDDHDLVVRRHGVQYGTTGRIASGGDAMLTVRLKPGVYNVYCSLPGHRQAGMWVKLRVT
jgi:sulfocyanin SoxE-like protein